ncbi:FGGY family carbohydrate kinase [Nocardioidaceae bacterium SCSIO 66511]|nr:FGGY family carbohydrate kinase [Nocardioidaceae bacterium SCSIO 66511]
MRFAGVDIGTSGLKLAVLDETGAVVAERAAAYRTLESRPGWCEIDPYEWLRSFDSVAADVHGATAIGCTGQMHGVVLTGRDGEPVRPAILWPDRRASDIVAEWVRTDTLADLGTPRLPGYAAAILAWLHLHEPTTAAKVETVWFAKDWLRAQLTGDRTARTDRSDAAGSLLWDPRTQDWSDTAAETAGIDRRRLPAVRPSAEVVGHWGGASVVVGAADTAAALVAYREIDDGGSSAVAYVNLGSGCQVLRADTDWHRPVDTAEAVFADAGAGWYTMYAFDARAMPSRGTLLDAVSDAVTRLNVGRVVVGGGRASDPELRAALARRLELPLAYAPLRSLSACGAAILAAQPIAPRIGLRRGTVEVSPD